MSCGNISAYSTFQTDGENCVLRVPCTSYEDIERTLTINSSCFNPKLCSASQTGAQTLYYTDYNENCKCYSHCENDPADIPFYCHIEFPPDSKPIMRYTEHYLRPRQERTVPRPKFQGPERLKKFYKVEGAKNGFNRGHLVPCGDFQTEEEKRWTMFLIMNIVPNMSTVNCGNMEAVEESIRLIVDKQCKPMVIFSGHIGELIPYPDQCVPRYLYKVLVDAWTSKPDKVVVVSNDPNHNENELFEPTLLPDWLKGVTNDDPRRGITKVMDPQEFWEWCRNRFPHTATPRGYIESLTPLQAKSMSEQQALLRQQFKSMSDQQA